MTDILESLSVASRLKESATRIKEADVQQQQQQAPNTQPQQGTAQASSSGVDSAQLEKAFEAALQSIKGEIVQELNTSLEKFGKQLVGQLKGEQQQSSSSNEEDSNGNNSSNDGSQQQQQSSTPQKSEENAQQGNNNESNQEENK